MIPWRPCTMKKKMSSTKYFTTYVQAYFYSKMKQMPFNLPHTQAKWQLEKDSLEWVKSKEGTFLDVFPMQPIKSIPCMLHGLVFQFFMISFFPNSFPYHPRGEWTSVCFVLRKCSWHQCPAMAILVLKALIAKKLKKFRPADFFIFHSIQVSPTTLRENSGSSAKKLFTHQHVIEVISLIPCEPSHNSLSGKGHRFQVQFLWLFFILPTCLAQPWFAVRCLLCQKLCLWTCSNLILIPWYDRRNQGKQLYSNLTVSHPCGFPVNDSLHSHCKKV